MVLSSSIGLVALIHATVTGSLLTAAVAAYGFIATAGRLHVYRHARAHLQIGPRGIVVKWWKTRRIAWENILTVGALGRHGIGIRFMTETGGQRTAFLFWRRIEAPQAEIRELLEHYLYEIKKKESFQAGEGDSDDRRNKESIPSM
jgi:hypothetical protein